jgi:hypothetical protein
VQEQEGAGERAEDRCGHQSQEQPPLAAQLAPVADRAAEVAGDQAEGVADRGRHRGQPDRQQDREADQGARADDGVDAARREAGRGHREHLPPRHADIADEPRTPPGRIFATRRWIGSQPSSRLLRVPAGMGRTDRGLIGLTPAIRPITVPP